MNLFSFIRSLLSRVFAAAKSAGLSDALVDQALLLARVAGEKFVDNRDRREWVTAVLVARGVPESLARLALELAVQLMKAQLKAKATA